MGRKDGKRGSGKDLRGVVCEAGGHWGQDQSRKSRQGR